MPIVLPAHRRVLGVSGDTEVLACGHLVPRFDRSEAFANLPPDVPSYPRVRRCLTCPDEEVTFPAALAPLTAIPEGLAWWANLGVAERAAWLDDLAPNEDTASLRGRLPRTLPVHAIETLTGVLGAVQSRADALGLTVREWASLSHVPLPTLSGWALARAAARRYEHASPAESNTAR